MSSINVIYRLILLILGTLIAADCLGEDYVFNIKRVNNSHRIVYQPYINGKKCMFMLDTGFFMEAITNKFADENHIKYFEPNNDFPDSLKKAGIKISQEVWFSMDNLNSFRERFLVVNMPSTEIEGIFSWRVARRLNIIFDWDSMTVSLSTNFNFDKNGYSEFDIVENRGFLCFQKDEPGIERNIAVIDTGDPGGISLSHKLWSYHHNEISKAERELGVSYGLYSGYSVCERYLVDRIDVSGLEWGPLKVEKKDQDVPEETIIGLQALSLFDVIVNGPENKIYFKSRKQAGILPTFDRSGFTFYPKSSDSKYLTAKVILDSPGYKAGLRDGDELLEFNGKDISDWKKHYNDIGEAKMNKRPIAMKVRRGDVVLLVKVIDY